MSDGVVIKIQTPFKRYNLNGMPVDQESAFVLKGIGQALVDLADRISAGAEPIAPAADVDPALKERTLAARAAAKQARDLERADDMERRAAAIRAGRQSSNGAAPAPSMPSPLG